MSADFAWKDEIAMWAATWETPLEHNWQENDVVLYRGIDPMAWGVGLVVSEENGTLLNVRLMHYVDKTFYPRQVVKTHCEFIGRIE